MSKFKAKQRDFLKAAQALLREWPVEERKVGCPIGADGYPFSGDFEQVVRDIREWVDTDPEGQEKS